MISAMRRWQVKGLNGDAKLGGEVKWGVWKMITNLASIKGNGQVVRIRKVRDRRG